MHRVSNLKCQWVAHVALSDFNIWSNKMAPQTDETYCRMTSKNMT